MDERRHLAFGEWQTGASVPPGEPFRLGQRWRNRRFGEEAVLEAVGDLWRSCYSKQPDEVHHGGVRWIFSARDVSYPETAKALAALELRVDWELVADAEAVVEPMLAPFELTSVLGERRLADPVWPDGSYSCPFCRAVTLPGFSPAPLEGCLCPNRECEAGGATRAQALEARERKARERAEYEEWQREFEARSPGEIEERIRALSEQRHAEARELSAQGFCPTCFLDKGKRIRHRAPDYHRRRSAA